MPNASKANVLERLEVRYMKDSRAYRIFLDGEDIGGIVQYGKRTGLSRQAVKTVFGSRIAGRFRIVEEAASQSSLLAKVAAQIARSLNAGADGEPSEPALSP